ncbi:MAG: sulfatase [Terriglobia bacterium]
MNGADFSRRGFLKSAVAGATAGAAGFPAAAESRRAEERTCGSDWEKPPQQTGNGLNLILIVAYTFRADNLVCYGPKWLERLETPNLDRFAQRATVFADAYAEVMPTIPIRRTLYTGRRGIPASYFPQHENVQLPGWHPLFHEDVTLSETLREAGYINTLISSVYHQFKPGRNFQRGFHTWEWIRGLEFDFYGTAPHHPLDVSDLVSDEYLAKNSGLRDFLSQYKANRNLWQQQGESVSQITAQAAIRWLNQNYAERPFYLHVEFFDPHEPWDPPRRFLEKYMPNARPPSFIEPPYDTVPLSADIKNRMRANYAGAVSCVDHWVGSLLETVEQFGLLENSVVVFTADHGAMLGEREQFLKGPDKLRGQVTHIPLLIHAPGNADGGKKVQGFVQFPDVMPTVLGRLALKPPSRVTGRDFWPLATGGSASTHEYVVQTYGWVGAVRNAEWSYSEIWKPEAHKDKFHKCPDAPAEPYQPQLYNLQNDPKELTDVADQYPDVARQMSARMKEYIASGDGLTLGSFSGKPSLAVQEGLYSK